MRERFRTLGALLAVAAMAGPTTARAGVESAAPNAAVTQYTNPQHRPWRKRAWRVGLGGNRGRNKAPRDRDRNKAPKGVQIVRLQRAQLKRLRRHYRNIVLAKRVEAGILAKSRWWSVVVNAPGYGQVGMRHTEGLYHRVFRPRVVAARVRARMAAQKPNAEVAA